MTSCSPWLGRRRAIPAPMVGCQVLRCRNEGAHTFAWPRIGALRMEAAICSEHKAEIEAGAPYRWQPDDSEDLSHGAIVMGDDLDASGMAVTKFLGVSTHAMVRAHDGSPAVTLQFETRRSDGTLDSLPLVMPESVANQLALLSHDVAAPSRHGPQALVRLSEPVEGRGDRIVVTKRLRT